MSAPKRANVYRRVAALLPEAEELLARHGFDPKDPTGEGVTLTLMRGYDGYADLENKAEANRLDAYGIRSYLLGVAMGLLLDRTAFERARRGDAR
jgi:hypothetical protein